MKIIFQKCFKNTVKWLFSLVYHFNAAAALLSKCVVFFIQHFGRQGNGVRFLPLDNVTAAVFVLIEVETINLSIYTILLKMYCYYLLGLVTWY